MVVPRRCIMEATTQKGVKMQKNVDNRYFGVLCFINLDLPWGVISYQNNAIFMSFGIR